MARGILTGIAAGVVVAGLGLGTASLMLGPVEMPGDEPERGAPEAVPQDGGQPQDEAIPPQAAGAPADEAPADDVGQATAPPDDADGAGAPEAPDSAAESDTSAAVAEDSADGAAASPVTSPEGADPAAEQTGPVTEDDGAAAEPTGAAPASAAPEQAAQPAPAVADSADAPTADSADASPVGETDPPDAAPVDDSPADTGTTPDDPGASAAAESAEPRADAPAGADVTAAAPSETAPAETAPAEAVPGETTPAEAAPDLPPSGVPGASAGDEAAAAPQPSAPPVVTGRLPAIGEAAVTQAPVRAPAIERNAIAFDAPADLPLLAIVLIDTGEDRAGFASLGKLPFPVSVAVDAGALDAAEVTALYRAAGLEVVTILPLPEGATAADIEINLEAYAPLLEDSVAAMAEEALGFQSLGEGAVQLAVNLAETGHGLVTFPAGLNTGHKAAQKEGVPAGLVFRDLDAEGQGAPVIRRFLDNAAFRARNESAVIVVARTREETVQALLEWSLGSRAAAVTLAPVSAVLGAD